MCWHILAAWYYLCFLWSPLTIYILLWLLTSWVFSESEGALTRMPYENKPDVLETSTRWTIVGWVNSSAAIQSGLAEPLLRVTAQLYIRSALTAYDTRPFWSLRISGNLAKIVQNVSRGKLIIIHSVQCHRNDIHVHFWQNVSRKHRWRLCRAAYHRTWWVSMMLVHSLRSFSDCFDVVSLCRLSHNNVERNDLMCGCFNFFCS